MSSGTIIFTSTFEDDDNDGVPNALEYDGDYDGDGIDDYIDNDDDGDNVLTLNENPRFCGRNVMMGVYILDAL